MLLLVSSGGPPPGNYTASFAGVEPVTNDQYGAGLRWKFQILYGPQAGQIASRTTGTNPTMKNGCGRILAGLLGRELQVGEQIDISLLVGRTYLIVVQTAENGGTRVETVVQSPSLSSAMPPMPVNSPAVSTPLPQPMPMPMPMRMPSAMPPFAMPSMPPFPLPVPPHTAQP
jgi:hypothetical protein